MRRFYLIGLITLILGVFLLSNGFVNYSYAGQNKASVQKLIQLSQKCVQNGDLAKAKEYARKAVQADPYSNAAWNNYDKVLMATQQGSEESEESSALEGC